MMWSKTSVCSLVDGDDQTARDAIRLKEGDPLVFLEALGKQMTWMLSRIILAVFHLAFDAVIGRGTC
jgi:hypothetical protein